MAIFTPSQYEDYFKDLAINNKKLLHNDTTNKVFSIMFVEELISGVSANQFNTDQLNMVLEPFDSAFGTNGDNLREYKVGAFSLVKHAPSGDLAALRAVRDEAYTLFYEILSKLKKDSEENTGIQHLKLGSIEVQFIGPIVDNLWGIRVSFTIDQYAEYDAEYDATEWNY